MKPCRQNRKLIAWLTLGALEVEQERKLRAHVESCSGCRRYLEEISTVAHRLQAVKTGTDIQAPEAFHRRALCALTAEELTRKWPVSPLHWVWNWRLTLPVYAATALMILAVASFLQRPKAPLPAKTTARSVPPTANPRVALEPTLATYETVANQSLEKFDELLSRQAERNPPPAPIYKASSLLPESAAE